MLYVIGYIAKVGNRENRGSDDVLIMDQGTVLGLVGVALGAEADYGRVLFVRDNAHDPVGGDGIFVQHEGNGLALFYGIGVHLPDVDQRTGVVSRLHGAGEDGINPQAEDPRAHQQQGQQHNQSHQHGADDIPDFFDCTHCFLGVLLFSSSAVSLFCFRICSSSMIA